MRDKKPSKKVALPALWVSDKEYSILEKMAIEHECTVPELIRELITPSGDKAARWIILQVDHEAYKTFVAKYEHEQGSSAEDEMERLIYEEGERLKMG